MPNEQNRIMVPPDLRRKMVEAARDFRKKPTASEAILWQAVRGRKLRGIKFRRQQPIGPFVVDFYAPELRLIVEIDGPIHESQHEADQVRQEILESLDMIVLRFPAEMVENQLPTVLESINQVANRQNRKAPLSAKSERGRG